MSTPVLLSPQTDLSTSALLPLFCCMIPPAGQLALLPNSRMCSLSGLRSLKKVKSLLLALNPGEKSILCYQETGVDVAAQVWWLLQVVGCQQALVLDSGLLTYQAKGGIVIDQFPTEEDLADTADVEIDRSRYKTDTEVRELISANVRNFQMLDTEGYYLGAINCPASLLLSDGVSVGEAEAVKLVLSGLGAKHDPLNTTIVIGKSAATVLLALASLGMRNLCLGIVNRDKEEFLDIPVLERRSAEPTASYRTEFFSFQSGNTEFFDAVDEGKPTVQTRDSLVATRVSSPPRVVRPKVEERREAETQHQCSACELS